MIPDNKTLWNCLLKKRPNAPLVQYVCKQNWAKLVMGTCCCMIYTECTRHFESAIHFCLETEIFNLQDGDKVKEIIWNMLYLYTYLSVKNQFLLEKEWKKNVSVKFSSFLTNSWPQQHSSTIISVRRLRKYYLRKMGHMEQILETPTLVVCKQLRYAKNSGFEWLIPLSVRILTSNKNLASGSS